MLKASCQKYLNLHPVIHLIQNPVCRFGFSAPASCSRGSNPRTRRWTALAIAAPKHRSPVQSELKHTASNTALSEFQSEFSSFTCRDDAWLVIQSFSVDSAEFSVTVFERWPSSSLLYYVRQNTCESCQVVWIKRLTSDGLGEKLVAMGVRCKHKGSIWGALGVPETITQ